MIGQSTLDKTIQTPSCIQTPCLIIRHKNQVKKHLIAIYYEFRVLWNFSFFFGWKKNHFLDGKQKKHFFRVLRAWSSKTSNYSKHFDWWVIKHLIPNWHPFFFCQSIDCIVQLIWPNRTVFHSTKGIFPISHSIRNYHPIRNYYPITNRLLTIRLVIG